MIAEKRVTWAARQEDFEERGVAREGLAETWKKERWTGGERSMGARRQGEKKVARLGEAKRGPRRIQKPRPGLVNTATESLVFLSTAATMGPQETKDERRAIYFGPLFRSSAESGLRGCLAHRGREREREGGGGER